MYGSISQTNNSEIVSFCESKAKCEQYRLIHKQMTTFLVNPHTQKKDSETVLFIETKGKRPV